MNLLQAIFVATVVVNLCFGCPYHTISPCSDYLPACAVIPDTYNSVFRGTLKFLYTVDEESASAIGCAYETYGHLDESQAAANYTATYTYGGSDPVHEAGSMLLTINGIRAYVQSDVHEIYGDTNYFTGSKNSDGVVIIKYCNRNEIFIGCNVNSCGSELKAKAKIVAEHLANSSDFVLHTVDFSNCTNTPA